jgi:hypothetical protein
MTEKTSRASRVSKLMAATSVLGLALGMTVQAADGASSQIKGENAQTTQIKGEPNQHKLTTGYLKHDTEFLKHNTGSSNQLKFESNQLKLESNQHKGDSTQIKLHNLDVVQHKHTTPSSELNPQPEPPKPIVGGQTPH